MTSGESVPTDRRDAIAAALDGAWGDWIGDTGCIPDCFTIHGPKTTRVEAQFGRGNFAEHVLGWLTAAGFLVVHPASSAEDCEDPYVCCIHPRPSTAR